MDNRSNADSRSVSSKSVICTPSPAAKNAFFYIQEAGMRRYDDGSETHRNFLESFLFAAVTGGKGEIELDGDTNSLTKGDCFLIDCRQPHNVRSSEDEPLELVWIHFNGATSKQYYDNFMAVSDNVFRPDPFEKTVSSISEIIYLIEQKNPNAEVLTSGHIVRLLTIALTSGENSSHADSALKQKLASVNSYIEEHFSEDLSLEGLASAFYISKFYLTREYKKIYGMTIFQHIITCRINYGKKLLRFSDRSVEEIAHMCGFNDQSYFVRQFKKAENVTCFAYRKMWRE